MDSYRTEEEQIEVIKQWWKENGSAIVVGLAIALAGVFGYKAWNNYQDAQAAEASALFQDVINVVNKGQFGTLSENDLSTFNHLVGKLKTDYSSSTYAQFGALLRAQQGVKDEDLEKAQQELQWVLDQKPEENIELLAKLRLARVVFAQNAENAQQALDLIKNVNAKAYLMSYEHAKGDFYIALNKLSEARDAYTKAIAAGEKAEQVDPTIQVKLDNIAVAKEGA
ncbi:YfgM family protein [Zooshikella harenae]|uniref:Tetratricopeptide repeat protein n=1 Tax=Zooshikella harenae TaxID=2827238 RepID=A0ABS5Z883_9GAMM|nr:tetratricopeptide repeat protein [Zooshikella harenae]MBU2709968.1 tetratricopeptide repeat protein [Zooshikella harenae]